MKPLFLAAVLAALSALLLLGCRRAYKPFAVELDATVSVNTKQKAIVMIGTTNLPDGTELQVALVPGMLEKVIVEAGQFAMIQKYETPGHYRPRVQMQPNQQPGKSKLIAPDGSNLTGDHVSEHPFFPGVRWYMRQWEVTVPGGGK